MTTVPLLNGHLQTLALFFTFRQTNFICRKSTIFADLCLPAKTLVTPSSSDMSMLVVNGKFWCEQIISDVIYLASAMLLTYNLMTCLVQNRKIIYFIEK